MGSLYLVGPTIQEVDGKMMMGLSIYGVAVISGSLYSRFYGISLSSSKHTDRKVVFETLMGCYPLPTCS